MELNKMIGCKKKMIWCRKQLPSFLSVFSLYKQFLMKKKISGPKLNWIGLFQFYKVKNIKKSYI